MNYNDYAKIWEASVNRTVNYALPSKSFGEWQKCAISARKSALKIKESFESDRDAALKEYSTSRASEMIMEMQDRYSKARAGLQSWVRERLDAVMQSKRNALFNATSEPTAAELRLLNTLKLRTKLSPAEVEAAAKHLSNNLQALNALADICESLGVDAPVITLEVLEEELDQAERVCEDMITKLDTPDKNLGYLANCFFNFPGAEHQISELFNELDTNAFTSEQVRKQNNAGNE